MREKLASSKAFALPSEPISMVYAAYLQNPFFVIQKNFFVRDFGCTPIKNCDKLVCKPKKLILSDLKVKITETPYSCAMNPDESIF